VGFGIIGFNGILGDTRLFGNIPTRHFRDFRLLFIKLDKSDHKFNPTTMHLSSAWRLSFSPTPELLNEGRKLAVGSSLHL
jgi:hypothetical protein